MRLVAFVVTLAAMLWARGSVFNWPRQERGRGPGQRAAVLRATDVAGTDCLDLADAARIRRRRLRTQILGVGPSGARNRRQRGISAVARRADNRNEGVGLRSVRLAAGLAGIVLASQTGSVSTDTGEGWELIAIAAVVVGGTLLSGGIGSVLGTLVGLLLMQLIFQRHRVREWPGNHLDQLLLGVGHPWRRPADRGARTGPGRKETPAMTEQSQHALDRNDEHVAEATEGVAPMVAGVPVRLANLIARAEALADSGQRRILGITGAPGSGKGTVAQAVLKALGPSAVVVPMDGFHLAGAELDRLGRTDRKGAPETFDAAGYVALLRRLREPDGETVYAPEFHRDVEESYAGAIAVPSDVPLVITEGNYLLLDQGPWSKVRELLDEAWFVAPYEDQRIARLVERHIRYGKTPEQAREWVRRSDELNAALVSPTRTRADIVILGDPT
jgi:pantothenate kinase